MIAALLTSLLASFAGSLHCAGMCGPLVALVQGGNYPRLHVAYQTGRIASYVLLGLGAGAIGHGIDTLGAVQGLEHAALIMGGLALGATIIMPLLRTQGHRSSRWVVEALRSASSSRIPVVRAALFGGATGLMPCGWLYAWLAIAAASGHVLTGGAVMLGFGLGSVPALVASNLVLAKASALLRRRARFLAPLALAAAAIASLAMRAAVADRIHRALETKATATAPLVCHGG